jgi:hypothetical protein
MASGKDIGFTEVNGDLGNTNPLLLNPDQSSTVNPSSLGTGNMTSQQVIKGFITVVDDKGVARMIMGYKPGAF